MAIGMVGEQKNQGLAPLMAPKTNNQAELSNRVETLEAELREQIKALNSLKRKINDLDQKREPLRKKAYLATAIAAGSATAVGATILGVPVITTVVASTVVAGAFYAASNQLTTDKQPSPQVAVSSDVNINDQEPIPGLSVRVEKCVQQFSQIAQEWNDCKEKFEKVKNQAEFLEKHLPPVSSAAVASTAAAVASFYGAPLFVVAGTTAAAGAIAYQFIGHGIMENKKGQ
jgi:hypothetical protein